MCLGTVSCEGLPSSRMVLAGTILDDGVTFYTDARSPKIANLVHNPHASILFYWPTLSRQVRLEGIVEILPSSCAEADFNCKGPDQQRAIEVCQQSAPLDRYWRLQRKFAAHLSVTPEGPQPRPEYWMGYCVHARKIEYLLGGKHRLNKRLVLESLEGKWHSRFLAP